MEEMQTVGDNNVLFLRGVILDELRNNEKFTDVVIVTRDGTRFPCHKIILIAGCPFFKGLFRSDMVETRENEIKLDQIDISGLHFKLILEYIYTGEIKLNFETALAINIYSIFFQMEDLKNITENRLINLEEQHSRLELWRHSKKYFNDKLNETCTQYILRNTRTFFNIYVNDLTLEDIKFIVSLKELKFKSRTLLENIVKWIKFDFENRQQYVKELMETINFDDIEDEKFKKEIFSDDILTENKDFLQLAVKYLMRQSKPVVNVRKQELFAVTSENIFYTDFDTKEFIKTTLCPNTKLFGVSCHPENGIIITGGSESITSISLNLCKQFCPSTNCKCVCKCATNKLPALLKGRRYHRNYTIGSKVYVCGGLGDESVEVFDESQKWINGPRMNHERSDFGAAHDNENNLYAAGGLMNLKSNKYYKSNSIAHLDSRISSWQTIFTYDKWFDSTQSIYKDKKLYCFGMLEGYIFDIRANKMLSTIPYKLDWWGKTMNFEFSRHNYDCTMVGDDIWVIGEIVVKNITKFTNVIKVNLQTNKCDVLTFSGISKTESVGFIWCDKHN